VHSQLATLIVFKAFTTCNRLRDRINTFFAYKLDPTKTYDCLDYDYLESAMLKLGFRQQWVSWVMTCVKSMHFAANFNGVLSDPFQPSHGLRDPLSPYLFLLEAHGLSLLLKKQEEIGNITLLKMTR
jgi:hypothetical protein